MKLLGVGHKNVCYKKVEIHLVAFFLNNFYFVVISLGFFCCCCCFVFHFNFSQCFAATRRLLLLFYNCVCVCISLFLECASFKIDLKTSHLRALDNVLQIKINNDRDVNFEWKKVPLVKCKLKHSQLHGPKWNRKRERERQKKTMLVLFDSRFCTHTIITSLCFFMILMNFRMFLRIKWRIVMADLDSPPGNCVLFASVCFVITASCKWQATQPSSNYRISVLNTLADYNAQH